MWICARKLVLRLRPDGRVARGRAEQAEGDRDGAKEARSDGLAGEPEGERADGGGEGDAQVDALRGRTP